LSFCKRFNKNIDIKFSAQIEQIIATYIILIKIKMASTLNILRQKSYHIFSNFMGGGRARIKQSNKMKKHLVNSDIVIIHYIIPIQVDDSDYLLF
jgi:hypothetical protein